MIAEHPEGDQDDDLGDVHAASWWLDDKHAGRSYVEPPPSDELIRSVEGELGHRLPAAYVALMRRRNGGLLRLSCCPAPNRTTWANDHVAINGIFGIGRTVPNSLCGSSGSRFWIEEWGYPDLGVYFADCPSAGHDMIAMDYRHVSAGGEPQIVHVDQEWDCAITVLAPSFTRFIRALCDEECFDLG